MLQPLPHSPLHQIAEFLHQGIGHRIDKSHAVAFTAHQAGALQLAQLAADVGLTEAGGLDQRSHIHGAPMLELTEQLQASRLAQQPKELAERLNQLGAGQGQSSGRGHGIAI